MRQKSICVVLVLALFLGGCNRGRTVVGSVSTVAAFTAIALMIGGAQNTNLQQVFDATVFAVAVGVLVLHTVLTVPEKVPDINFTEIGAFGVIITTLTLAVLLTLFTNVRFAPSTQGDDPDPLFPQGQGPNGLTIHANMQMEMPEGEYYIFHMNCGNNIPLTSTGFIYQYAFVMDSDGITENNYTTGNNDFFNDTDRWYELSFTEEEQWTLAVKTAFNNNIVEVASAARVIITSNAMLLVVPASEFSVEMPNFRVTAFCHTGDFGIPEPHNWSGDLHPPVAEGLQTFPVQPPIEVTEE